jgi:soluble lytic murein transglycosylase-like protein
MLKSVLILSFAGLLLTACDIEPPSFVNLNPGSDSGAFSVSSAKKRLPARYLEKNTSVRLAKIQARRFELDPAMILGVITQESAFNANAVSWAGAQGLMQLMPGTVEHIRRSSPVQISSAFNPVDNMAGGSWYLRSLYDQFRAYPENQRWQFALASYNGGAGRVNQAITKAATLQKKNRQKVNWQDIKGFLPSETRNYVPAVMLHARYYRQKLKKI